MENGVCSTATAYLVCLVFHLTQQQLDPSASYKRKLAQYSLYTFEGATVVQEVEKSVSNQKVASSIPCQSVLEQDTEPLIAPDVQCVNVKCVYILESRFG